MNNPSGIVKTKEVKKNECAISLKSEAFAGGTIKARLVGNSKKI